MFVTIEGIDGVGKSTCSKLLAENENFVKISKRAKDFSDIIINAKKNGANETTLHFIYLSSAVVQSHVIRNYLQKGFDIVVARWTGTQAASHRFHSKRNGLEYLKLNYKLLNIIQPDLSFLLFADDQIRKNRMASRGEIVGNDLASLDPSAQILFKKTILEVYDNVIEIDTTNKTPEEVLQIMRSYIYSYKVKFNG